MSVKGTIKPAHVPRNKITLLVVPMIPITIVALSGIEEELETVVLPDRTNASGGNTKPGEFTIRVPLHHTLEQIALEEWYGEAQDPVRPAYKRQGTLLFQNISGLVIRSFSLFGIFPSKRSLPDLEMANEGEEAEVTWTLKYDEITPV